MCTLHLAYELLKVHNHLGFRDHSLFLAKVFNFLGTSLGPQDALHRQRGFETPVKPLENIPGHQWAGSSRVTLEQFPWGPQHAYLAGDKAVPTWSMQERLRG